MNLPAYFLADLPTDASLSPSMITAACHTLKRNREKFLKTRSTQEIIGTLCEVAAGWLNPQDPIRRAALEEGPAATGFSRPVLEKGLDDFFRKFTPEGFESLLCQELGHAGRLDRFCAEGAAGSAGLAMARGPEFLAHIAAGNLPNPTLMSLTLGLLTRSAQFVKCASQTAFLPRLFAHSLYAADRKLGACLEIAEWPGGQQELEAALFAETDCLTATGSDETLASVQMRLPSRVRFLGYGQRVSLAYISREVLRPETMDELLARMSDDVIAWDQNGCLSPQVIYVEERGEVESDQFAERLALTLARREAVTPRGQISTEAAAAIASRRSVAETLAALRADVKIWASPQSTAWTVVFEHDVRFQFSPLNRFIYVKPVPDPSAAMQGADSVRDKISTIGLGATPEKMNALANEFGRWGALRVCPVGSMQNPPLQWRHDGRPVLGDLLWWTDFENVRPGLDHQQKTSATADLADEHR